MWFCYKQNGKEIRSITNLQKIHWIVKVTDKFPPFSNGDTKIMDWITSKKPICRRHPINLNNNIKDISQKKICKKRYRYNYLSLIFVIQTMKVEVAYSKTQHYSTLDAPKTFEWLPKQSSLSQSCLLKRKKSKMLQNRANKTTIIPSKISSAYECKTIALLPWFELAQFFWTWMNKQHATFLCI